MVNKWKVFGLTVATWIALSIIAKMYGATIHKDLISISSTVWAWSSLVMGFVMRAKTQNWNELAYGVGAFFICLLPVISIFIGIAYFARCYYQMELLALNQTSEKK